MPKIVLKEVVERAAAAVDDPCYDINAVFDEGGDEESDLEFNIRPGRDPDAANEPDENDRWKWESSFSITPTNGAGPKMYLLYGACYDVSPAFWSKASFKKKYPNVTMLSIKEPKFKGLFKLVHLLFKDTKKMEARLSNCGLLMVSEADLTKMKESYVTKALEDANIARGKDIYAHAKGDAYKAKAKQDGVKEAFNIHVED